MAKIVFGAGVSHSPVLTLDPSEWEHRSQADYNNSQLNTSDGRWLTYTQLEAEVGTNYTDVAKFEIYREKAAGSHAALDRVAKDLAAAAPDVVIIVGDDQRELFSEANQPAMAIYHGETVTMMGSKFNKPTTPTWLKAVGIGYAMDKAHEFPGAPSLGLEVIQGLIDKGFDIGTADGVPDPDQAGFGHAYGFVVKRLFGGRSIPILPLLLNTYYPPNVPTAARCYDLGRALREVIEASPSDHRVAIIASGGLSHFIVDEALDQRVLNALRRGEAEPLRSIPRGALNSGSSEILNWITLAGALEGRGVDWADYYPIFRTPAGTGVGVGFASWTFGD